MLSGNAALVLKLVLVCIFQDIERLLPTPDVSPLLDNLEYFRHNIYKSLPHSKWGSSRDAFCFRRVKTHVDNFKVKFTIHYLHILQLCPNSVNLAQNI